MGKWSKTEDSRNTSSHPDNKKQRQENPTQERMWEQKVTMVHSFLLCMHALCASVCLCSWAHTCHRTRLELRGQLLGAVLSYNRHCED